MATLVQSATDSNSAPATINFSSTPTAGNLLIIALADRGGDTTPTLAGDTGWTEVIYHANEKANSTYRTGLVIFAKISEGDETGDIDVDLGGTSATWAIGEEWSPDSGYEWDALGSEETASAGTGTTLHQEAIASGNTGSVSSTKNFIYAAYTAKWANSNSATGVSYTSTAMTENNWITTGTSSGMGVSTASAEDTDTGTKATTGTYQGDTDDTRALIIGLAVFSQTATASGTTASAAVTYPIATVASSATQTFSASAAVTYPIATVAASATQPTSASAAVTYPIATVASNAAQRFLASGAATYPIADVASTAVERYLASASVTYPIADVASAAIRHFNASAAVTYPIATVASTAVETMSASAAVTYPIADVASAATAAGAAVSASAAVTYPIATVDSTLQQVDPVLVHNDTYDGDNTDAATHVLTAHNVPAGDDRILILTAAFRGNMSDPTVSSDVDGAFTKLDSVSDGTASTDRATAIYYLLNPSTGNHTVTVTRVGSLLQAAYTLISMSNVDQNSPFGTVSKVASSSSTLDLTPIDVDLGDKVLDSGSIRSGTATVGADQTEVTNVLLSGSVNVRALVSYQASVDGAAMTWSRSNGDSRAHIAVAVNRSSSTAISGAVTYPIATVAATATAGTERNASAAITYPIATVASSATNVLPISASAEVTYPIATVASAAASGYSASVAVTYPIATVAATAAIPFILSGEVTYPIADVAAVASVPVTIIGSITVTVEQLGSVSLFFDGTGAHTDETNGSVSVTIEQAGTVELLFEVDSWHL